MSETLDIVKLIEKNPITRLSKDYQSNLIAKVKSKFTEPEQQLFVTSFYCYLNHNSNNDFIIEFDNIWKWVGFSRKDPAKRLLEKYFVLDLDYKQVFHQPVENLKGGRPQEQILMTINTFKKFCLKADTKKADEIHNYYIKLEDVLHDTMNEETLELRNQLLIKDSKLQQNYEKNKNDLKLIKHQTLIDKIKGKRCIYISEIKENKFIKIGMTKEISTRHIQLNKKYGNSLFLEVFECDNYKEVEENILADSTIKKHLYKGKVNGHCCLEILLMTEEFNYEQLVSIVKKYLSQTHFFTPEQLLEKQKMDLEKQKMDLEKYKLENNILNNILNNEIYYDKIKQILENSLPIIINNIKEFKPKIIQSTNIISSIENINIEEPIITQINDNLEYNDILINDNKTKINLIAKSRKTFGRKIQKIDPNNLKNIIKIYDSMMYLLRSPENNGFQKGRIQDAIKSNKIYKDFRWNFVNKDEDPNISIILPTVECKTKKHIIDTILKLNSTKTEILDSYATKAIVAKELKINIRTIRKIIDHNEKHGDNYFIEYNRCPKELIEKYDKIINKTIVTSAKQIKQINPTTNEIIIFKSLTDLYTKYGISNPYILKAIEQKKIFKGYLWEFV